MLEALISAFETIEDPRGNARDQELNPDGVSG
jgi:hypothetical protein